MSRSIRTLNLLQDLLDKELSWRVKELDDLKSSVRSAESFRRSTMTRAALALLYAHWEGFVKNSATAYLEYVDYQGHKYVELDSCFVVIGLKKSLDEIIKSKQSVSNIMALDFIRSQLNQKARLSLETAIKTESNLSSSVFLNICKTIGLDASGYETKYNLIDESLLNRRNKIAHGEYIDVDSNQYRDLTDEIIGLLRCFKTDIENAASLKKYMLTEIRL